MGVFILIFIQLIVAGLIAENGKKRLIGYNWSFFFSMFFSILIGWLVTDISPKKIEGVVYKYKRKKIDIILSVIYFTLALFFLYGFFYFLYKYTTEDYQVWSFIHPIVISIGFVGAGLFRLGVWSNLPKNEQNEDNSN